jgi:HTH-type transcriptional regulator, sugar sensing transcriptional regulator
VGDSSREEGVEALTELGFTRLEAEVYAVLVEESPMTAYRAAQALGKAAANVYKAVESLARKGAVLVDDGETRVLRAVAPSELFARVEHDFKRTRAKAERALERLHGPEGDDRVYQLRSREQVLERAETMLQNAQQLVAIDLFPEPLDDLREAIGGAVQRGVKVLMQVYEPTELPGVQLVLAPRAEALRAAWPAQWLNLVCDAREHMLSLSRSNRGEVVQAVWSGSAYLSVLYYSGLVAELEKAALLSLIEAGASATRLRKEVDAWAWLSTSGSELRGVAALQARLGK